MVNNGVGLAWLSQPEYANEYCEFKTVDKQRETNSLYFTKCHNDSHKDNAVLKVDDISKETHITSIVQFN